MKIYYSFIIPHHNSPDLLNRCLDSIPQREDIEIIVVDDKSDEDKRPLVIRSDVQIVYIDAEQSKGAGKARNVGLGHACGKWLLFADCDDFYEKNFICELDKYKDSLYDIIFFDAYLNYDITSKKCKSDYYKTIIKEYINNPNSSFWKKMLKHGNNATWMRMYSHEYIKNIDVKYDEIPACNDGWFVQYAGAMTDNIAVIPHKLYYYVETEGSITKTRKNKDVEIQRLQASFRINHLLAEHNAYCAIPPFFHGIRNIIYHYGRFFALKMIIKKLIYDISPIKLYYYKQFYNYDKES